MAEERGVWRTIRGRRVFIREGEDLASAMKRSGKFDNSKRHNVQTDKAWKRIDKLGKENAEIWKKTNRFDHSWYDENGKLTKEGEKLYNKREKNAQEMRELQQYYTDYQPRVWEDDRYNNPDEYTGDTSSLEGKHIKELIKDKTLADVYSYTDKQIEEGKNPLFNFNKPEQQSLKKYIKDNKKTISQEPKKSTYETLKEHILSHYTKDYGYDAESPEKALIDQVNYMKYSNRTNEQIGKEIATGGGYLIYNQDMREFLDKAGISYKKDGEFDKYTEAIGVATAQIINEYNEKQSQLQLSKAKQLASEIRETQRMHTSAKLEAMSLGKLRSLASEYNIDTKGLNKDQLLARIKSIFK